MTRRAPDTAESRESPGPLWESQLAQSATQRRELSRVQGVIGGAVLEFARLHVGREFHLNDLVAFVRARHPIAADSASRVLRDLRQSGAVAYAVESRAQSKYRIVRVTQ